MAENLDGPIPLETPIAMTLDVTGLPCPLPVLKAKKALSGLPVGALLEVLADDPAAPEDMAALCLATGHHLVRSGRGEAGMSSTFRFLILKRSPPV